MKVHTLDSNKEILSYSGIHLGGITTLQLGSDGQTLVTGGEDGTCRVWMCESPVMAAALSDDNASDGNYHILGHYRSSQNDHNSTTVDNLGSGGSGGSEKNNAINNNSNFNNEYASIDPSVIAQQPLVCIHVLCGHESPVTALSYSQEMDMLLSGSQTGTLCLHTVRNGRCAHTIPNLRGHSIDVVLLTTPGYLVAHSWSSMSLDLFWLNGQPLHRERVSARCVPPAAEAQ